MYVYKQVFARFVFWQRFKVKKYVFFLQSSGKSPYGKIAHKNRKIV